MMGNCLKSVSLIVMAVLACSCVALGQTAAPKAAAKPQPTGPRDLAGVWRRSRRPPDNARKYTFFEITESLGNEIPPMTAWGEEKFKANKPNVGPNAVLLADSNDPIASCLPPGLPRIYGSRLGAPFEIFQVPGRVIMYFEYDHYVRQIFLDGRQHSKDLSPTWMGDSIGKWEGNTLVVDTIGFNDKTWLDQLGHPHSEDMHLVERIQRVGNDAMNDDITIDDPKTYTKPWVAHIVFELKPGWEIVEYVCADFLSFKSLQDVSESNKK